MRKPRCFADRDAILAANLPFGQAALAVVASPAAHEIH